MADGIAGGVAPGWCLITQRIIDGKPAKEQTGTELAR